MTSVLVLGAGGQDGTLLARRLLADGRRVVGTVRPNGSLRRAPYLVGVDLVPHDVRDADGFAALIDQHGPDEIYNLAGFTSVGASWSDPDGAMEANCDAVEAMLDVLLRVRDATGTAPRFFQASSSEIYGADQVGLIDESTAPDPRNPYGDSKCRAQAAIQKVRESEGLFACVGILFNHESPLRRSGFVTGKITRAAAEIAAGHRDRVTLGNLDVSRDWGWADDYVAGMQAMLAHPTPADYVLATGRLHSLRDLVELAFSEAGIGDPWAYVEQDPALLRPVDVAARVGDPGLAERQLGWRRSAGFEELVAAMVAVDVRRVSTGVEEDPAYAAPVIE